MVSDKARIEYVDLVKGFCMFFVISFHCHVTYCPWFYNTIRSMYLPAFFFCSALFFKADQPFRSFLVRKVNLLLVPWAFFLGLCFCGFAVIYLFGQLFPGAGINWTSMLNTHTPYDFIRIPANLPSWYLWCIFFAFMAYYAVCRMGRRGIWIKALVVVAMALLGWYFERYGIRSVLYRRSVVMQYLYDFHFFTALEMLPFMFAGEELRRRGLLGFNYRSMAALAVFAVSVALWVFYSQRVFVTLYGHVWPLEAYIPGFAGTSAIFILMAALNRFPLLDFLGRNSLTVLCTHYMIFLVMENYIHNLWWLFACVLALTLVAVKFCITYFPLFTGRGNFFPLSRTHLSLS